MKTYVKQKRDWNHYAFYVSDVDEKYWDFFQDDWWQLDNNFIRSFEGIQDFHYCASNFEKYGTPWLEKVLYHSPSPWKKALKWFAAEMETMDTPWLVFGSVAMTLWGMDVKPEPNNINISFRNFKDYEKIRQHFAPYAIQPFGTCSGWFYSGYATLYVEDTPINIVIENEGTDLTMKGYQTVNFEGHTLYLESLENLRNGNLEYGRPERAKLVEEFMQRKKG